MVFILDQALHQTLTGTNGKHSMYDYICWEYLLGEASSPCIFSKAEIDKHRPDEYTARDNAFGWDPTLARAQYDRIVSRWCFPEMKFVCEVTHSLFECLKVAVRKADYEKTHGDRFKGTAWDSAKPYGNMYLDLYHTVQTLYGNKDNHPWGSAAEVDEFIAQLFKLSKEHAGKLHRREISLIFGWNADKQFPKASLCGCLLKHLRSFVNTSILASTPTLQERYAIEFKAVAEDKIYQNFKPVALFWFLTEGNEDGHGVHHFDRTNGLINCTGASGQGVKNLMFDIKANRANGRNLLRPEKLAPSMILSGYAPHYMTSMLQTAQQNFRESLGPFETGAFLKHVTLDLVKGTIRDGEVLLSANFDAIRTENARFQQSDIRTPTAGVDVIKQKTQELVPSTDVKQPKGLDLTKFKGAKEAEEDSSSMGALLIGACAVLAFFAFR